MRFHKRFRVFGSGQGGAAGGGSYQEENSDCKRQADSALQPQRGTLLSAARSASFIRASRCFVSKRLWFLQAITARDSMAKSLYSALFDWIVLRINHALLNKKDMEESVSVSN